MEFSLLEKMGKISCLDFEESDMRRWAAVTWRANNYMPWIHC